MEAKNNSASTETMVIASLAAVSGLAILGRLSSEVLQLCQFSCPFSISQGEFERMLRKTED